MNKITLHWEVKHNRAGRFIFCEGASPLGTLFLIMHFIKWEDRRNAFRVIQSMQQQATAAVLAWEDVAFLMKEAHTR